MYSAQGDGGGTLFPLPVSSMLLPGTWSLLLGHPGCKSTLDALIPGTLGEGRIWAVGSAPRNRMKQANWEMLVALSYQAHFQGCLL